MYRFSSICRGRLGRGVAVEEDDGGVVCHVGATHQDDGVEDPAHLCHGPRQRQHAGPSTILIL